MHETTHSSKCYDEKSIKEYAENVRGLTPRSSLTPRNNDVVRRRLDIRVRHRGQNRRHAQEAQFSHITEWPQGSKIISDGLSWQKTQSRSSPPSSVAASCRRSLLRGEAEPFCALSLKT